LALATLLSRVGNGLLMTVSVLYVNVVRWAAARRTATLVPAA
jgi:hypothetical protein